MGEIIHLHDRKKKPETSDGQWRFTVDVYDGPQGVISDFNDSLAHPNRAEGLREFAKMLDVLSFLMKQQAEDMEPSEDGECLAQIHIYESSRTALRINDDRFVSDEQKEWFFQRLEDAGAASGLVTPTTNKDGEAE